MTKIISLMTDAVDKEKAIEVDPADKSYAFVGSMRKPNKTSKLFKFGYEECIAKHVELHHEVSRVVGPDGKFLTNVTFTPEPKHIYTWALNQPGAQKKIMRFLAEYARREGLEQVGQTTVTDPVQQ